MSDNRVVEIGGVTLSAYAVPTPDGGYFLSIQAWPFATEYEALAFAVAMEPRLRRQEPSAPPTLGVNVNDAAATQDRPG